MMRRFLVALFALFATFSPSRAQQFMEQDHIHIGVVLPLTEQSTRGPKMVEFYQGILLAADSLRRDGLFVEVEVHDCGRTQEQMDSLIASRSLAACDIIFGPLDAIQVPSLSDYCDIHGIRLVQPFATTTALLPCHPRQYVVTAPRDSIQAIAVDFVRKELFDHNYVLVDSHEQNEEGVAMANALRYNLSRDGAFMRLLDIDANDLDVAQAFNPLRRNLVIINSPSIKALNKLLPKLKDYQREHPDCKISMLGYPSWQTYTAQLLQDFYEFDTFVYTPFYRNPKDKNVQLFEQTFTRWFNHPMANTFPRYAMMGFDLAYYFLRGISLYGTAFERHIGERIGSPLQNPLVFVSPSKGYGYVNRCVQFVHYTRNQDIEVLMRTE